jgi:hypothetical protein
VINPNTPLIRALNAHSLTNERDWTSVLHAAHQLEFPAARSIAVIKLCRIANAVTRIVLAHRYDIRHWLLDAYVSVCMRKELLSLEEGIALGVDVVIAIYDARQRIQSLSSRTDLDEIRHTVWQVCCSSSDVLPPSRKAPSTKSITSWSDSVIGFLLRTSHDCISFD